MVIDIIISLKTAFDTANIKFCFVDEVALTYYNVPRAINGLELCVPQEEFLRAQSLIASQTDLFTQFDWTDKPSNYYTDYKRPYPRFESITEDAPITLTIFPDVFFHLDPLEENTVRVVEKHFEYSEHFDFSSDRAVLSSIPVPKLAPFFEGLLRKYCDSQDYKMAMCAEQLVDGMNLEASWCNSHLDTRRHNELQFALDLVKKKPLRISQFEPDNITCYVATEDVEKIRMIPGYSDVSWSRALRGGGTGFVDGDRGDVEEDSGDTEEDGVAVNRSIEDTRPIENNAASEDNGGIEDDGLGNNDLADAQPRKTWIERLDLRALMFSIQARAMTCRPILSVPKYNTTALFQTMSDLHLEVGNCYSSFDVPQLTPYLILAGDIGRLHDYQGYVQFLTAQCAKFEQVFLVLGNHEFYKTSRENGLNVARSLEKERLLRGKLTVLNRSRVDVNSEVTILGCTLHSHIPEDARLWVNMRIADFTHINGWTIDNHNFEHQQDVKWLKTQIGIIAQEDPRRRVLIVTHHAPSFQNTCNPKHMSSPVRSAFCTDLLSSEIQTWSGRANIHHWVFGHTHWTSEFRSGKITFSSNQRGYVSLNQITDVSQSWRANICLPLLSTKERGFDVKKIVQI